MHALIQPIALLLVIAAGYVFKRLGRFGERDYSIISVALFDLILPGAIVYSFATHPHDLSLLWLAAVGFVVAFIPIMVIFVSTRHTPVKRRTFLMLNAAGLNIGCFCFPVVQAVLGDAAFVPAAMFDIGNSIMVAGGTNILTQLLLHIQPDTTLGEQVEALERERAHSRSHSAAPGSFNPASSSDSIPVTVSGHSASDSASTFNPASSPACDAESISASASGTVPASSSDSIPSTVSGHSASDSAPTSISTPTSNAAPVPAPTTAPTPASSSASNFADIMAAPTLPYVKPQDADARRLARRAVARTVIRGFVTSVPFMTYIVMIALMIIDWDLPGWVAMVTQPLANANAFCAMLMVGMLMDVPESRSDVKQVLQVIAWRLPFSVLFALALWVFLPFDAMVREAVALCCLAPIPVFSTLFTDRVLGSAKLAGFSLAVSAIISLFLMISAHHLLPLLPAVTVW
ncbi:AEC family transporter [Bifidobacterium gallicum]|uniref:Permease n=1 Tax=Bifidobacterium gallicum DSM 20093 = LMG 11596 TaxID=561180 RepID=A0A087AGK4_9BIFI|nr:AEC family transporter [Bifidobacterium gallicum]KFI57904.1 permease [Bifidobacterium gallicum DSM 20093 = LMG 11596]